MELTFWERINDHWNSTYYIEPIVIIISLLTTVIGIKFFRKENPNIALITYSLSCFLLFTGSDLLITLYQYKVPSLHKHIVLQTANIFFSLVELSIFYYYYSKIIKSKIIHMIMKFSLLTFSILVIFSLFKINDKNLKIFDVNQFSALITTIQFLLLLIPVFIYFFELFINEPIKEIKKRPSIWIHIGVFIYVLVTLPFLIISESLDRDLYKLMYALHFVSLNILLLTIIKAFLCRKPITT